MPVRLPYAITACLCNLDGVLTDTGRVDGKVWKEMFDTHLRAEHADQAPFDSVRDYDEHVDRRPRCNGVRSLLTARGIASDGALVPRLGDRENELVRGLIRDEGVEAAHSAVFEDALAGVEAGCAGGFATVVGVDRVGPATAPREHGATVVVEDLAELVEPG